jgi:phosphomannomutase
MDSTIFKAYDIRGIYPEEINEAAAYNIGRAFVQYIKKYAKKDDVKIVLGRDNRLSSLPLFSELERGVVEQGGEVIDIGLSTTPIMYFSVVNYGADGGINVTASHNPKQYNGLKLVKEMAIPVSEENGIKEIRDTALAGNFDKPERPGTIANKDPKNDYILSFGSAKVFDTKVIVDTANSVSGTIVPDMFKNVKLTHIFSDFDGSFPNHEPDPLKEENTAALRERVKQDKAGMGIAFDGDGDRVFFIDENGDTVSSDLVLALVASLILRRDPVSKILYDVRCSNIVRETVEKLGGEAVMSRVGHSFIKAMMREQDISFGGEYSGHYYARYDGKYYFENPYFVAFSILQEMEDTGKPFSQLIAPFRVYYHSGEINFRVENKEKIIEEVKERYSDGRMTLLDGLRIDFDDWWLSLRASNTEPLLRLIVEGKTKEKMEEKLEEIRRIILS